MKRTTCLLVFLASCGLTASESEVEDPVLVRDHRDLNTTGAAFTMNAGVGYELLLSLNGNQRLLLETTNASPLTADPVIHLWGPLNHAFISAREIGRDDDGGEGVNARLSVTVPVTGTYLAIVRPAGNGRGGTATLQRDGVTAGTITFGGAFRALADLRAGERITTVPLPGAPAAHVLYLLDDDGVMRARVNSGLNEGAGVLITSALPLRNVMVATRYQAPGGPVRLVRNDVALSGHDPDGDGLGSELEAAIGTCSSLTGLAQDFDCSRALDARDTDGDAIRDDLELLGKTDSAPYQLLPRWGASPRHKDIFVELDFKVRYTSDTDSRMSASVARSMASIYGDPETDALLRALHASALVNPDGEPGISLHLDSGVAPETEADLTIFGDWGGHNVVPATSCDASTGECTAADPADVWSANMHPNRHGLFHYALTYPGSGGAQGPHAMASTFPHGNAPRAAHELGHSLGLGHNGPYDGEPADANCKPNYPSLMNYAYPSLPSFSDGYGRAALNNVALKEIGAVPSPSGLQGRRYLDDLEQVYGYTVDRATGDVDWNRDGVMSSGTVSAYANNNGNGCEFTKYNRMQAPANGVGSPAFGRLGDLTMWFYEDDHGRLRAEYTTNALTCPALAADGCGPTPSSYVVNRLWTADVEAFDVHRIRGPLGESRLLFVYRDAAGRLFETTFSRNGFTWTDPVALAASPSIDEPALGGSEEVAILAYKGTDGRLRIKRRSLGLWSDEAIASDASGAALPALPEGSSPAVLRTPDGITLVAAATYTGATRIYTRDPSSGVFTRTSLALADGRTGRPSMAWAPLTATTARLYVLTRKSSPSFRNVASLETLVVRNDAGTYEMVSYVGGDLINTWLYANGVDALFEPGTDSNLRTVVTRKDTDGYTETSMTPAMYPKADGIVDFEQRNWSDWEVFQVDICRTLAPYSATPVRCPAWRW